MIETLDIPKMDDSDSPKAGSSLDFLVFPGQITVQMPLLIKQGRTPISIYELARQKLIIRDIYRNVTRNPHQYPESFRREIRKKYDLLWNKLYDTGDMWLSQSTIQGSKGKLVLYNADVLEFLKRNLNPQSRLTSGYLTLDGELQGAYDSFTGNNVLELNPAEISKFFNKLSTRQEAKESPFWRLALGDLKDDYIDAVFLDGKEKFGYREMMQVRVTRIADDVPTGTLFYITSLYGRSCASTMSFLERKTNRLVGVAPGASTPRKPAVLEQMV